MDYCTFDLTPRSDSERSRLKTESSFPQLYAGFTPQPALNHWGLEAPVCNLNDDEARTIGPLFEQMHPHWQQESLMQAHTNALLQTWITGFLITKRKAAAGKGSWLETVHALLVDATFQRHGVDSVARRLGLSRGHFTAKYKSLVGLGPGEEMDRIRHARAMKFLLNTDLRIDQIAYKSGYATPSAFCRAFRRQTGQSPKQMRLAALG